MPFVPYIFISLAFFKSMQGKNFCLLPLPLPLLLPLPAVSASPLLKCSHNFWQQPTV